jgi:hypothetical protein
MDVEDYLREIQGDWRYREEYEFALSYDGVIEFIDAGGAVCVMDDHEPECMIYDYDRAALDSIERILKEKKGEYERLLITFNVSRDIDEATEIEYLRSRNYEFYQSYDSYVAKADAVTDERIADDEHIVEMIAANVDDYSFDQLKSGFKHTAWHPFPTPDMKDMIPQKYDGIMLAYADGNEALGYLKSFHSRTDNVNLPRIIYVAENHRNCGIATKLLQHLVSLSKKNNHNVYMSSTTAELGKVAIKAGFEWCSKHMAFHLISK